LTPAALEGVLADFRAWLQQFAGTLPAAQAAEEPSPPIDLHTLLGQFIALRHEVNLQTKAARSQQELTGQAIQRLDQALETLRHAQSEAQQAPQRERDEAVRPLLKTLLDVHDAFSLAEREISRIQETVQPLLDELAFDNVPGGESEPTPAPEPQPPASAGHPSRGWWQRWFSRQKASADLQAQQRLERALEEQRQALAAERKQYEQLLKQQQAHQEKAEQVSERLDQLLDSIVIGYRMSLQRLERALQQSGLEPIPCIGQPFDPEQMEVVAAVADTGCPGGEVIEEVRRGYRWHGRIFRYAQVSVAKS
jgi:molecular chaperone GrpE